MTAGQVGGGPAAAAFVHAGRRAATWYCRRFRWHLCAVESSFPAALLVSGSLVPPAVKIKAVVDCPCALDAFALVGRVQT